MAARSCNAALHVYLESKYYQFIQEKVQQLATHHVQETVAITVVLLDEVTQRTVGGGARALRCATSSQNKNMLG